MTKYKIEKNKNFKKKEKRDIINIERIILYIVLFNFLRIKLGKWFSFALP